MSGHKKNERDLMALLRDIVEPLGGRVRVARQAKGAHVIFELEGPWGTIRQVSTRSKQTDHRTRKNLQAEVRRAVGAATARQRA